MLNLRKWWELPITIMGHLYEGSSLPKNISDILKFKKKLGFDAEHWLGSGKLMEEKEGGDDGKSYYFKTRVGFLEDRLTDYLKVAKKFDFKVIVYLNVHWFNSKFGDKYFIKDKDNKPVVAYGSGYLTCPNSPFLDWSLIVAEDLGKYDIAGVFLDGPICRLCFCESCQKKFKEKYGISIPTNLDNVSIEVKKYLREFPIDNLVNYLKLFKESFNKYNPTGIVYHNGETFGSPGFANLASAEVVDILGSEGGFIGYGPLINQFFFKTSATSKLIESQAKGKPTVIFIDFAFKMYDYYSHSPTEIFRAYSSTISNGANPWFLIYPNEITPGIKAGITMNKFIQKNRKILTGTKSLAKVALLYSGINIQISNEQKEKEDDVHSNLKLETSKVIGDHFKSFQGMYSALSYSQIPFDIIVEETLKDRLSDYDLLILPNVMAMSKETIDMIKNFVKKGGNLFATFNTSLYDEKGIMRKDYGLGEVFGCSIGEIPKPTLMDYISVKDENLLKGLSQKRIPCPYNCHYVKINNKNARSLILYYNRIARRYALLPDVSEQPAGVLNRFGKGKALFIPSEIDKHYLEYNFPEYRQVIANAVNFLSKPIIKFNKGTNFVEVSLRKNSEDQILVYLINLTGKKRPAENIIPFENLKISLKVKNVKKVYACFSEQYLKYKQRSNGIELILPLLKYFELIKVVQY